MDPSKENNQSEISSIASQTEIKPEDLKKEETKPAKSYPKLILIFAGILILIIFISVSIFTTTFKKGSAEKKTPAAKTSPSATPDPVNSGKTYNTNAFSFKYPSVFSITQWPNDGAIVLNHNIVFYKQLGTIPTDNCKGNCPVITASENTIVNSYQAKKYYGYMGAIGDNIPQSFIRYEIQDPNSKKYFDITLYELPVWDSPRASEKYSADRKIGKVSETDEKLLDKIVLTFKLTGQDEVEVSTPSAKDGVVCDMLAKLCPDGKTFVGRDPENNCEFKLCP